MHDLRFPVYLGKTGALLWRHWINLSQVVREESPMMQDGSC